MSTKVSAKRPEGTKVYKQKSATYVYHVVDSVYQKDKQYNTEKRKCIGKMVDDENMIPNDNFFVFYPDVILEEDEPEFSDAIHVATSCLLHKIMKEIGIWDILHEVYNEEEANFMIDIISYMITKQTSTMQHYSSFAFDHLLASKRVISDTSISNFLKANINNEKIENFLNKWNQMQKEGIKVYINCDSMNMNNQSKGIEMVEFGHAKDDDRLPQVNVSYAINQDDATPLFYEMYPGSIIDGSKCKYMADRVKEFGYKNVGFILDRGYVSASNIRMFDENEYDFVMMMKLNGLAVYKQVEEVRNLLKNNVSHF